jgi:hypothetical protein
MQQRKREELDERRTRLVGQSAVIYLANSGAPFCQPNTTGFGPALLKITIT